MSLLLGLHPSCWFVHKFGDGFSGRHHSCPRGSSFWLWDALCLESNALHTQCGVCTKCLSLFSIFRQTCSCSAETSPGKNTLSSPCHLSPSISIYFLVKPILWHMNKKMTLTGTGTWAVGFLSDRPFQVFIASIMVYNWWFRCCSLWLTWLRTSGEQELCLLIHFVWSIQTNVHIHKQHSTHGGWNELFQSVSSKDPCVKGLGTSPCYYVEVEERVGIGKNWSQWGS